MSVNGPSKIVRDGLVLSLDAGNVKSYVGSGNAWTDLSRNSNNGTLTNGPTFSSANGGSIVFDGVDDYVACPNIFSNSITGLSIEVFVKLGKIDSKQAILSCYLNSQGWGLEFLSTNIFSFFGFSAVGVANGAGATVTNSLNDVTHVVGTFNALSNFCIYLNGHLNNAVSTNYASLVKDASTSVHLGNDPDAQVVPFGGNIYYARLYNRALSSAEVLQNYNTTRRRFGLS